MGVSINVNVVHLGDLVRTLERISPKQNRRWVGSALLEAAKLTQTLAQTKYIIRGGRVASVGPRGGRRIVDRRAHPSRLTSRHGNLRASIGISVAGSPRFVSVGTDSAYAAIHEVGGRIRITPRMRRVLHAKGIHPRKSTTQIRMPKRPFMKPALDEASKQFEGIFLRAWEDAADE